MSAVEFSESSPAKIFVFPWVFGPRQDLTVALGGMAAGFALLGLYLFFHINMVLIWFIWVITLDTPHFFATYFRTYMDKEEWRTRRPLLLGSLGVFLIGPTLFVLAWALHSDGVEGFKWPWRIWGIGVSLWAYFHITRQHYGVLRLYNRKNGEIGGEESKLDAAVLYGVLGLVFAGLAFSHPELRGSLGLAPWTALPGTSLLQMPLDHWVFYASATGAALLVLALLAYQFAKFMRGEPINLPKLVFLGTVMLLNGVVGFSGLLPPDTLLGFTAIITIYHDIQYLFIVWFYSGRHYRAVPNPEKFGLAGRLAQSLPLFFASALVFASLPIWSLGCAINRVELCGPGHDLGAMTFMGDTTWILFFVMLTSGVQMHHYVLDMVIWRPSRNRDVREGLGFEGQR